MEHRPMMKCGHAANSQRVMPDESRIPACVICAPDAAAYEIADNEPDFAGRVAKCGPKCAVVPSAERERLAFFEYRGPGSRAATLCRHCAKYAIAHDMEAMKARGYVSPVVSCKRYEPRTEGYPHDLYYCGCRGWD